MNLYIYKRISTVDQLEGTGLDQQCDEATISRVKSQYGLKDVVELESGIGLSGFHGKHLEEGQALKVFIDQCKANLIPIGSILLIYSLDRISRMTGLTAITDVYAPIVQNGVRIYTKAEGQLFDDSDMSQLMATLLFQRSHNESKTKSDRTTNAIKYAVRQYLDQGIRTKSLTKAMWYIDNVNNTLNEWGGAAKYMVALRCEGHGYKVIAEKLQAKFPKPPIRKDSRSQSFWTNDIIAKTFKNLEALQGNKVVNVDGETYNLKNYYPAIATPEQVLQLSRKPKGRTPSKTHAHVALIKPRCGVCGYTMHYMERRGGSYSYFCSGAATGKSKCSRNYVGCDFIDKWALLSITAIAHLHTKEDSTDNHLTTLKLEQSALKNQLSELTAAYKDSKSPTLFSLIVEAEEDIQKVTSSIDKLESNIRPTLPTLDKVMNLYHNFDTNRSEIKQMFESLIDTLTITKIPMEKGNTWKLSVTSGRYTFKQSVEVIAFNKLPKVNVEFPDYELTDDDIIHLSVSYGAINRLIKDGHFFDLFKGVSKDKVWKEFKQVCIDRINDRHI